MGRGRARPVSAGPARAKEKRTFLPEERSWRAMPGPPSQVVKCPKMFPPYTRLNLPLQPPEAPGAHSKSPHMNSQILPQNNRDARHSKLKSLVQS